VLRNKGRLFCWRDNWYGFVCLPWGGLILRIVYTVTIIVNNATWLGWLRELVEVWSVDAL